MKRLHVHISVPDLQAGIHFYSQMFGERPTKEKQDYAKWQLEDPMVNFAISTRSQKYGLDHLGLQVEEENDIAEINKRLSIADLQPGETSNTTCCYAESVKSWSFDTAGIPWETFTTMADAEVYGVDQQQDGSACCDGAAPVQNSCGGSNEKQQSNCC